MVHKMLTHMGSNNIQACWCGSMQRPVQMHKLGAFMLHNLWAQRHRNCGNLDGMSWTNEPSCNRDEHNLSSKDLDA